MKRMNSVQRRLLSLLRKRDKQLSRTWSDELGIFIEIKGNLDKLKPRQKAATLARNFVTQHYALFAPKVSEENLTVLLVEQKLPFARRLGDRFVILDRGRKVAEDKMENLSDDIVKEFLVV